MIALRQPRQLLPGVESGILQAGRREAAGASGISAAINTAWAFGHVR